MTNDQNAPPETDWKRSSPPSPDEEARKKEEAEAKNNQDEQAPDSDDKDHEKKPPGRKKRRIWLIMLGIGLVFAALLLVGLLPRLSKDKKRKEEAEKDANALTIVTVEPAAGAPDTTRVELPADTRSNRETFVFARANGFVKSWSADIGARVQKGQLLALLSTPDLDQQVAQARASLNLARTSFERLRSIELPGAISKQELDEGRAQYEAQQAVLNGLLAQQGFRRVTAPFGGIVTQRNVEVGSLVSSSNAEGTQLFKIEQTDTLRAFVDIPQNFVAGIEPGVVTEILVPEYPNRTFPGRVARDAGALNAETRTLLTQVQVPNTDKLLRPGMFAQVRFQLPRTQPSVIISANALVPSGIEPRVVVVENQKIRYQTIVPGRDFGDQIEVTKGLKGGEMLVVNPIESLRDGQQVEARKPKKEDEKPGSQSKPNAPERPYDPDRPRMETPADKSSKK
ncbi:efflux transporter, RND family, MFP subunit [Hymenobacter roseosalivarius DSM 11622]|uniref:Efflux transporter, RND family, MFP subunit n=1 Tax=Hymenobacter roseosalivarius DSM 11622 TaxID=645990 RepID=A0A1W1VZA3_9BACT|nr:efflux RND transporter periplasmic adaptor subunit [Hymenobacter roseosalivarius]SMB98580.1 efflux transporter, RND family, MFP subunit [Hymenobacter roseosalivarius DSM 11622]